MALCNWDAFCNCSDAVFSNSSNFLICSSVMFDTSSMIPLNPAGIGNTAFISSIVFVSNLVKLKNSKPTIACINASAPFKPFIISLTPKGMVNGFTNLGTPNNIPLKKSDIPNIIFKNPIISNWCHRYTFIFISWIYLHSPRI